MATMSQQMHANKHNTYWRSYYPDRWLCWMYKLSIEDVC